MKINWNIKPAGIFALTTLMIGALAGEIISIKNTLDRNNIDLVTIPAKTFVLKEGGKFTNAEKIYEYRLNAISDEIDMPYNKYVKDYIDAYVIDQHSRTEKLVKKGEKYFPMMEKVLRQNDLPPALKSLAVVESALNPTARSPVGAVGLWQIMPRTGRELKLKIGRRVDQRKDPYLATRAAAKYLTRLNKIYDGDWLLALAAYNCGPGNVNKAIRKSGGQRDFWAIRKHLPRETQNYVPKFIAACYAMKYLESHKG